MSLRLARRTAPAAALTAPATIEPAAESGPDPVLVGERERLVERMTIMQSELGGLFYEMAIRDHVRMDVLIAKAAELQGVDIELAEVERRLGAERARPG